MSLPLATSSGAEISRAPAEVAQVLRADVVSVRIGPGEAVTEAAVASRFGVSRSTARLAIDQLVGAGLLRREANRGARVPILSRADIVDLYDNRALVEAAALRALAERGSVPPDAVRHNRSLATAPDSAPFAADDIAFHRALVASQSSPRLTRMHESLLGEIELCIGQVDANALWRPADIARQHAHVLDAVVAADADLAARLVREHIVTSRDRLLEHVDAARPTTSTPRPHQETQR
ncbi:putative D-xylose utilization operon transcriptional repressor [Frondihabitans sp. 762G35]|uniref:GntR family transcriptional regulator n=1 Tax=Frondihabitans sp. 762G35 TaxID=1446794 RepID=UPI000D21FB43|nr:FCD domain-containing protein [Frondihabitans sp. 762G35]ARC57848.1 putative D-xylose utilization operon transcriptional repressor [Frondihabitans sp. 762G35]